MTGHTLHNPRQRGLVYRMRGKSITAREVGEPPSQARVVMTEQKPLPAGWSRPVGMVRKEKGVDVVQVDTNTAVRYVQLEIAAKQSRVEKMLLQVEGLRRSIARERAAIAAMIGTE